MVFTSKGIKVFIICRFYHAKEIMVSIIFILYEYHYIPHRFILYQRFMQFIILIIPYNIKENYSCSGLIAC